MNRVELILTIAIASMLPGSAQRLAAAPPIWTGSVRCEIDVKRPGYVNHQTHTWTLADTLSADGSPLDYPGTWSVTGAGSLLPPAPQAPATWKIQGSAPGVRMAIFVRQSDQQLLVFLRHAQLNAPEGMLVIRQPTSTAIAAAVRNQPTPTPVSEWRSFPTIVDAPTSTHVTGSTKTPLKERLDAMQPLGSEGQSVCTWDLVQGRDGSGSGAAPVSGAVSGARAGAAAGAGGAAGAGAATNPSAPVAAGCDADLATVACQLPQMFTGSSIISDGNFHVAGDTSDWYTLTAMANGSAGAFAVLDFSLTGGTADGSYSIEVNEGAPSSLRSVGISGAAHAPKTTVAWSAASAGSKTLFIQVRHVAGAPANDLYSLRVSMSASQTAPLTVVPLAPGVISAILPSTSSQPGTVVSTGRSTNTRVPPASSGGTTSTPIPQDGMPNTCAAAGNKVVNVSPGLFMIVTGGIEAAGVEDWLTVQFPTTASVHATLGSAVPIPGGSDFQITTYSACGTPLTSATTGGGIKTVDLPGSGPHTVFIRITASRWNATGATYSLRLEGK